MLLPGIAAAISFSRLLSGAADAPGRQFAVDLMKVPHQCQPPQSGPNLFEGFRPVLPDSGNGNTAFAPGPLAWLSAAGRSAANQADA